MAPVALLLGCPATGDEAVEQQRRKGATSAAAAGLSCGERRTNGVAKKKGRDREGKKQIKNKKMCAEKISKLPPQHGWLLI